MPKESYIDEQEQSAPTQSKITREETFIEWFSRNRRAFNKDRKESAEIFGEDTFSYMTKKAILKMARKQKQKEKPPFISPIVMLEENIPIIQPNYIQSALNKAEEQNEIRERINKLTLITACKENQSETTLLMSPIVTLEEEIIQPEINKFKKEYSRPRVTDSTPYSLYMLNVFIEAIISWFQKQFTSATRNIHSFFSNSVSTVALKNEEYLPQATNA